MSVDNICKMTPKYVKLKWQNFISISFVVLELLRKVLIKKGQISIKSATENVYDVIMTSFICRHASKFATGLLIGKCMLVQNLVLFE